MIMKMARNQAKKYSIQDLNIDDVASIRRNPVICDIFSRLKLMERHGSGLRKIIDQYPENAAPSFRAM